MDVTDNDSTNVIEVQFARKEDVIPDEVSHPASKNFHVNLDEDPLHDLLHEFDHEVEDQLKLECYEDYIHHLVKAEEIKLEMSQNPSEMANMVLSQVNRLKEDFKRMKFYLDELNLDD